MKQNHSRAFCLNLILLIICLGMALNPLSALEVSGKHYLSLNDIAKKFGMKAYWIEKDNKIRLLSEWTQIDFEVHKREILLNKIKLHLGDPIVKSHGTLYMSEIDLNKLLEPILTPQLFEPVPKLYRIVIDAGHGGKDPGTQNEGLKLKEKSLVLDLSHRIERKLQAYGYQVILTREDDRFIELTDRSKIANTADADLFLSIHFNATTNSKVQGIETYVFTPKDQPSTSRASTLSSDRETYSGNENDPWNTLIGYYVHRSLIEQTRGEDRGLKRARFTVLRDLKIPGILIESGFVSNPFEGKNIGSEKYRDDLATAIVNGVLTYQKSLNRLRSQP